MVLGFGEGAIEIELGPKTAPPNEALNGKVKLILPKPTHARSLVIEFYGEIKKDKSEVERINVISQVLGEERVYNNGETFDFTIELPKKSLYSNYQSGFGAIVNFFIPQPRPNWFLHARLDIPMAVDINSRIPIYLKS